MKRIFLWLCSMILALSISAKDDNELKPGKEVNLPEYGIKFKLFKDFEQTPMPLASAMGTLKDEAKTPVFHIEELFLADQSVGYWTRGNSKIYLGMLSLDPTTLKGVYKDYTTKEVFKEWKSEQSASVEWTKENLEIWAARFSRSSSAQSSAGISGQSFAAEFFSLKYSSEDGEKKELYIFKNLKDSSRRFALLYVMDQKTANSQSYSKALKNSVASFVFFPPKQPQQNSETKKQLNIPGGKKSEENKSAEYLESREKVLKSIKDNKNWWYIDADDYIIVSNMESKQFAGEIQKELTVLHSVYDDYYKPEKAVNSVSVARIFNKRDEYLAYAGPDMEFSAGLWDPSKEELLVSPPDKSAGKKEKKENIINIIQHEGFHQYLYYATGKNHAHLWFNEGNAQFFEHMDIKGPGKYQTNFDKDDLETLKKMMESGTLDIARLVKMDRNTFYAENRSIMHENYVASWGLVYFILKGSPMMKGKEAYPQILERYYKTLSETGNPDKANAAAWNGVDIPALQKDMEAFWKSNSLVSRSLR